MSISVKELLETYFLDSGASIDKEYQKIFSNEGERKTEYIRSFLRSVEQTQSIDISKYLYISIGGADGSEVDSVLRNSTIKNGIVIEYSDAGSDRAREKSRGLKELDKTLKVIQGDAMQRLPDCLEYMTTLKTSGQSIGAIVSCQAVLHELPKRSPTFREDKFWAQILSVFPHNIVVIREPMEGERWNHKEVYIKFSNVPGSDLLKIAQIVNDKLRITDEQPFVAADNFLALDSQLAIELLHKVLRANNVDEFRYELGERLTSFSPDKTRKIIESHLGAGTVRVESFNTDGFIDAWNSNEVKAKDKEGNPLSIPTTHCRLLGVSKTTPEAHDSESNHDRVPQERPQPPVPDNLGLSSDTALDEIKNLTNEFQVCRMDRYGKSRRRALDDIIDRLNKLPGDSFVELNLQVRLWQQKAKEARNRKQFIASIENVQRSFQELLSHRLSERQEYAATLSLIEWTIDFSQKAGATIGLNKIVVLLNNAIKYLGIKIGLDSETTRSEEERSKYLCLRAKCKRALASTYQKRLGTEKKSKKEVRKIRADALHDAERAWKLFRNGETSFELSLCLFANSATTETDNSKRAMSILHELHQNDSNILPSYEYIKQLRMRHRFKEAIIEFLKIAGNDKDRRRFHEFTTHFAASVIGYFYSKENNEEARNYALEACRLMEEVIHFDHHGAREVVDLCFLKGICGFTIEDSKAALDILKGTEDMPWSELAEIAQDVTSVKYDLQEALFWGLDEPAIWSRIGTFYSDFVEDYDRALRFYDYASHIDPTSPVYHFNKARIYAHKQTDYLKGRAEIDYALNLIRNKYGWYKNNKEEILDIKAAIHNLTKDNEVG